MAAFDPARVKQIVAAALDRLPAERDLFVAGACTGDPALLGEVLSLLAAMGDASADRFLGEVSTRLTAQPEITETAGTRIGPYKLLQQIGEGGFGVVFMAEQDVPVRRRVALKVIKLGMDTRQVVARFEQERQALALMDHPHIAKVFDAGATNAPAQTEPDAQARVHATDANETLARASGSDATNPLPIGRPFFVMEYVIGDPITAFADAHKLTIRDRLGLFSQVCAAVQHAHTKGVIHRDLKPRNVLVSMVDGRPHAKVIDFGIAKATGARLTDKTLFTEHGVLIGTPMYMSPEQAEGSPDIDTRTDVYALGVLLYELLTGATPFDGKRLGSAGLAEMQRIIREEEPPKPSVRLVRDLAMLAAAASARQIEPTRLSARVRGELDWIVMKALEKDRARRYESPNQLAADVRRHLSGEPVVAVPPSVGYRVRKFVRRHRALVASVLSVAGALVLGTVGTGWGLAWALAEQKKAQAQTLVAREETANARLAELTAREAEAAQTRERERAESATRAAERSRRLTEAALHSAQAFCQISNGAFEEVPSLLINAVRILLVEQAPEEDVEWVFSNLKQSLVTISNEHDPVQVAKVAGAIAEFARAAHDQPELIGRAEELADFCLFNLASHDLHQGYCPLNHENLVRWAGTRVEARLILIARMLAEDMLLKAVSRESAEPYVPLEQADAWIKTLLSGSDCDVIGACIAETSLSWDSAEHILLAIERRLLATGQAYSMDYRCWLDTVIAFYARWEFDTRSEKIRAHLDFWKSELFGWPVSVLDRHVWPVIAHNPVHERDANLAVENALAANSIAPNDVSVLSTLGAALYRAGRFQDSLDVSLRANELNGGEYIVDWVFICMAQVQLGDLAQARASRATVPALGASDVLNGNSSVPRWISEIDQLFQLNSAPSPASRP